MSEISNCPDETTQQRYDVRGSFDEWVEFFDVIWAEARNQSKGDNAGQRLRNMDFLQMHFHTEAPCIYDAISTRKEARPSLGRSSFEAERNEARNLTSSWSCLQADSPHPRIAACRYLSRGRWRLNAQCIYASTFNMFIC